SSRLLDFPALDIDPANVTEMTQDVTAFNPVQPTPLTMNVESVMPSRFAGRLTIAPTRRLKAEINSSGKPAQNDEEDLPEADETISFAPVTHIADRNGALVVDYAYGRGRVIVLSDPYLVTNVGLRAKDNLQLAINALTGYEGLIAFDEYHQGRGSTG